MPVVWFSKTVHPTTRSRFTWDPSDQGFVWTLSGRLAPGIVADASQYWRSDLNSDNLVNFTKSEGAYTFADQRQGEVPGSLFIEADGTITPGQAAVGAGMAGAPTLLVQANPHTMYQVSPHPQYWIVFGRFLEGEVLDVQVLNNPAQIEFPVNTYSMTAILKPDFSWEIKPSWQVNEAFLAAREKDENTVYGLHAIE